MHQQLQPRDGKQTGINKRRKGLIVCKIGCFSREGITFPGGFRVIPAKNKMAETGSGPANEKFPV
jgi:hypothetical protein